MMERWGDGRKARKRRDEPWEEGGATQVRGGALWGEESVVGWRPHQCGLEQHKRHAARVVNAPIW